jgi:uncharacterized protein YijF (DUF1287 family)
MSLGFSFFPHCGFSQFAKIKLALRTQFNLNLMKKKIGALLLLLFIGVCAFAQATKAIKLSDAAINLTKQKVVYDPAYFRIPYPNGDVPAGKGVCTDVVIRAFRILGVDLQKEVHEDMLQNFKLYPKDWGRKTPDPNIDHRRVYNLMVFFTRKGTQKAKSTNPTDYQPGDIVCWNLSGNISHIGLVINKRSADNKRFLIVHNIGRGQEISDCLFAYKIIGHYQYKV